MLVGTFRKPCRVFVEKYETNVKLLGLGLIRNTQIPGDYGHP